MKAFFIFAGELSGDLHGSRLICPLKENFPGCSIIGVAGPRMREESVDVLLPMEEFEVMGFTDVLYSLPRLWRLFYQVRDAILAGRYDAVILIDYPGFNLRLAKALRKQGFKGKIIQYVSPTVWAHGRGRIRCMAATLDLLLTIYPFEAKFFAGTQLPVVYVGNPLQEYLLEERPHQPWRAEVGINDEEEFVAIFPGSREGEISRNLLTQLNAAQQLKEHFPSVRFTVSCAHAEAANIVEKTLKKTLLKLEEDVVIVPKHLTYPMMSECKAALAKSGTVTLELALRRKPTVVTYQLTSLNKFIAQYFMRVNLPYYCIVNILQNDKVFPEFIDVSLPVDAISEQLYHFYVEGSRRDACIEGCCSMSAGLGFQKSARSAAKAIGDLFA